MRPNENEVQPRARDGDIDRHNSRTVQEIYRSGFPPTGMHKQSAPYLLLIFHYNNFVRIGPFNEL